MPRRKPKLPDAVGGSIGWRWKIVGDGEFFALDVEASSALAVKQGHGSQRFPREVEYSWPVSGSGRGLHLRFAELDVNSATALLKWAHSFGLPLRETFLPVWDIPDFRYPFDSFRAEVLLLRLLLDLHALIQESERSPRLERGQVARLARLCATLERLKHPFDYWLPRANWPPAVLRLPSEEEIRAKIESTLAMFRRYDAEPIAFARARLAAELNGVLGRSTSLRMLENGDASATVIWCMWDITPIYADFWWDISLGKVSYVCAHPLCGRRFRTADAGQIFCREKCRNANQAWRGVRHLVGDEWQEKSPAQKRAALRKAARESAGAGGAVGVRAFLEWADP